MLDDGTPAEALDLRESSLVVEEGASPVSAAGEITLHVIRPGLGKGRGRHLYESKMLQENATKFAGWKMYVNHLSPEAKKAAGGLPRDVRDLGGRIIESWWDDSVPADAAKGFGQGAVVARAKPTPLIRDLIENDPEIIEASISATATGVNPRQVEGKTAWVVEGIEDRGSVDWVTEAGAGGRVVSLMEAAFAHDTEGRSALLASMSDDEFTEYLTSERPSLVEAMAKSEDEGDEPDGPDEDDVKKWMAKGMSRKTAMKMSKNKITESEEDDMEFTPETLREALESEDFRSVLLESIDINTLVEARVQEVLVESLPDMVEEAVAAERDLIRATARADADRRVLITEMRATAHEMIQETRLPDAFKSDLKGRFDVVEGSPTAPLDVVDDIDEHGEVSKTAAAKLKEAVEQEIAKSRELVAAANPTAVRGQGPSGVNAEGERLNEGAPKSGVLKGGLMDSLLQEAGFEDTEAVYDPTKALAS